ncbi:MAG TPA: hypothetical protein ENK53_00825, partial [Thiotrichales bacterium]|nr:hypothetical protein [Thiotrichales bacterium]
MNQIQPAIHSPDRLASLRERIDACLLADRPRLLRELERIARRARAGKPHDRLLSRLEARLGEAEARRERRLAAPLKLAYPEALPVSARRDDILA